MPESFFNKVAGLTRATLLKKRLWYRCSPVNFAKVLRKLIFIEKTPSSLSYNVKLKKASKTSLIEKGSKHFSLLKNKKKKKKHIRKKQIILIRKHEVF